MEDHAGNRGLHCEGELMTQPAYLSRLNKPTGTMRVIKNGAYIWVEPGADGTVFSSSTSSPSGWGFSSAGGGNVTNGNDHDHYGGDGAQIDYTNLSNKPTLGDAASKNVGSGTGDVSAGNHTHGSIYAEADHTHSGYVAANAAITGASKCKISYDAKGLVTSGANLGTGDIPDLSGTYSVSAHTHDYSGTFAPLAKGVTNGDSHDHAGGDGAQIDHTGLSNIGTNTHAQIDTHIGIANPLDIHGVRRSGSTRPRWYTMPLACTALSVSGALTADRFYAIPFYCPKAIVLDSISINCTTTVSSGAVQLGIYGDTNGEPDARILDAGNVATTSTGVKTIAINQSLAGGTLYWLVALSKSATHAFRAPALAGVVEVIGEDAACPTTHITHFYAAQAYGALPANFPTVTQGTGIVFPLIYVHSSSGGK
jgi:hypothetical protein